LGGSYYVEEITDAMEAELVGVMADLERYGGMVKAIEEGYVQRLIAEQAYRHQRELESGERAVVGVNRFTSPEPPPEVAGYELDAGDRARQRERLAAMRRERESREVSRLLREVGAVARGDDNLMPVLVEAVQAYCTVGEISDVLREAWGEFRQPVGF
jgi:methylmalonyl-CoA mutase, N-terminal domain